MGVGRNLGDRSIPACAGEPRPCRGRRTAGKVYPRVCGGTSPVRFLAGVEQGLSPRVRGNRGAGLRAEVRWGSIPACAGEPVSLRETDRTWRVYPRVCGGTPSAPTAGVLAGGLSPRVRGNHTLREKGVAIVRSIPACAGEPLTPATGSRSPRVYPRVCGGTQKGQQHVHKTIGLSPRVRGNRARRSDYTGPNGSIPACAGEPAGHRRDLPQLAVYPRVCGGTAAADDACHSGRGLSPRVRGNRRRRIRSRFQRGSIPACAGEPPWSQLDGCLAGVYPRVCGGTHDPSPLQSQLRGLSPRVRGNLSCRSSTCSAARSIPACAGEPGRPTAKAWLMRVYPRVCGGTSS